MAALLQIRVGNLLFKFIEAIKMPWYGFNYSMPIIEPFRIIRSRVVKSPKCTGIAFSSQPNIKEEKWSGYVRQILYSNMWSITHCSLHHTYG